MPAIVEGLIIGGGAGLSTAIMLGIGRLLIWYWHRREQKTYIRNLMGMSRALLKLGGGSGEILRDVRY